MTGPTPEMLADWSLGACSRVRDDCGELGPFRPFYQAYVCDSCLRKDQSDIQAHRSPPGLFRKAD
jgi:hypothetical protein